MNIPLLAFSTGVSDAVHMQAEKRHLESQVEALTSQQALAQDESAQDDESINLLQTQLAQMKQQMDASSTALQALEDGSLGHGSPAESTRLNSLKDELAHVRLEKTAADEATQQAVQKFSEVCLSGFDALVLGPLQSDIQMFFGCSMNGVSSSVFPIYLKARLRVR